MEPLAEHGAISRTWSH